MTVAETNLGDLQQQVAALRRRVAELERQTDADALAARTSDAGSPIDAIFVSDNDLTCRQVIAVEGFPFRMKPAVFVGRPIREFLPAEFCEKLEDGRRQLDQRGGIAVVTYVSPNNRRYDLAQTRIGPNQIVTAMVDATQRHANEVALRQAADRFRLFAENSTDMISRHDASGAYIYASPACRRIMGYEPIDLVGRAAYDFIHPDDIPAVVQAHSKVLLHSEPFIVTFRLLRKDGSPVWVETTSKTINDPQTGKLVEIQCATRDVSERKRVEDDLRTSREEWRSLVANSTSYITRMDASGIIRSVNRVAPGVRLEDVIGANLTQRGSPEGRPILKAALERVMASGESQAFDIPWRRGDGPMWWFHCSLSPVFDAGKGIESLVLEARDITKEHQAQEQLKESEVFLNTIVDHIPMAVFVKDARDHFRVKVWNRAAEQIFGRPRESILGRTTMDEWPPAQAQAFDLDDRRVIASRTVLDIPEEISDTATRGPILLHTRKAPLFDSQGNPTYVLGICDDITQQKIQREETERLQRELRHAQRMESLGTLASGVAHDLKNLLLAISGYTEISAATLAADHPARQSLRLLEEVADQARGVTDALLNFGEKPQAPRSPISLRQALNGAMAVIRRLTPRTITIEEDVSGSQDLWVNGSVTQLQRVLFNLSINAREAMPGGGTFSITLRAVPAPPAAPASGDADARPWAEVCVRDTGEGMPDEVRRRIFEPFFSTRGGDNSGLGMTIVERAVREHDGSIDVDSAPGAGTAVIIRLPTCPAVDPHAAVRPPPQPPPSAPAILIAENVPVIRRLIATRLRWAGHVVIEAESCAAAEAAARGQIARVRLLVISAQLPGFDPQHCATAIKDLAPGAPVIFLTSPGTQVLMPDLPSGPPTVVTRPFQMTDLIRIIEERLAAASALVAVPGEPQT